MLPVFNAHYLKRAAIAYCKPQVILNAPKPGVLLCSKLKAYVSVQTVGMICNCGECANSSMDFFKSTAFNSFTCRSLIVYSSAPLLTG